MIAQHIQNNIGEEKIKDGFLHFLSSSVLIFSSLRFRAATRCCHKKGKQTMLLHVLRNSHHELSSHNNQTRLFHFHPLIDRLVFHIYVLSLQPYIVYLGSHSHGPNPSSADMDSATNSHYDLLASVLGRYKTL